MDPECLHEWSSDQNNKFELFHHHRLWLIDELKGRAFVKTTFGSFELKEKHCYFIPSYTLLETSIDGVMVQSHAEFLINSIAFDFNNLYTFNYISDEYDTISKLFTTFLPEGIRDLTSKKLDSVMAITLSFFEVKENSKYKNNKFLYSVINYIEQNISKPISTKDIANYTGYALSFFSNKFTALLGVRPQQFIINKRIEHAKIELMTTTNNISTIANNCGLEDPLYFSRLFKKNSGCSPTEFRTRFATSKKDKL